MSKKEGKKIDWWDIFCLITTVVVMTLLYKATVQDQSPPTEKRSSY